MLNRKKEFWGKCRVGPIVILVLLLCFALGQSVLASSPALTVGGTLADGITEQDIRAGGQTIVLTLENATFVEDVISNETKRTALLTGLEAGRLYKEIYEGTELFTGDPGTYDKVLDGLEDRGWRTEDDQLEWDKVIEAINAGPSNMRLNEGRTEVVITIPPVAGYDIFFSQTIQVILPAEVLVDAASDLVVAKPFIVDAVLGSLSWDGDSEKDIIDGGKEITITTTFSGGFAAKVNGEKRDAFIGYLAAQTETEQWAKVKNSLYNITTGFQMPGNNRVTITLPPILDYDIQETQQVCYYFATGLLGQTGGGLGGTGAAFPIGITVPKLTINAEAEGSEQVTTPNWPAASELSAANISKTSLILNWTMAEDNVGVTAYKIYKNDLEIGTVDGNITTYNVTGLSTNTGYTFKIEAGNAADNWSTDGPALEVRTKSGSSGGDSGSDPGGTDTQLPTWPDRNFIKATKAGDNVILEWPAAADNVGITGYNIYHGTEKIGHVEAGITDFIYVTTPGSETGSLPYSVQAVDAAGNESTDGPSKVLGGSNLPLIYEYGFYRYDPDSNAAEPVLLGELKTSGPWSIKNLPCTFAANEAIALRFATNVSTDAHFAANQAVIKMYDASQNNIGIKVSRSGDGSNKALNRRYLFVAPQVTLEPGKTYKIIVGSALTSNNGMQAGVEQEMTFTTSASQTGGGSSTGGQGTQDPGEQPKTPEEQSTTPEKQAGAVLTDIAGHWAENNIEKLVGLSAVLGYPDGSFKPDKTISRAEFVTILVKALQLTANNDNSFADTAGHWAEDAIAAAVAHGIVQGYNESTFGPDDTITREQMAVMVVHAEMLTPATEKLQFSDSGNTSDWALEAVITAVQNGIMVGYPGNVFLPRGSATRAEAVTVIVNILK